MNVSKPGSAASEFVVELEVVEERGRKGLRVRREVSISFLACLDVLKCPLVTGMDGMVARLMKLCLEIEVLDNYLRRMVEGGEAKGEGRRRRN